MNILFVCSANRLRSRTAVEFFQTKFPEFTFDSCGIYEEYVKNTQQTDWPKAKMINEELVKKADVIVCMSYEHKQYINAHFEPHPSTAIKVWGIADIYDYNDPTLIQALSMRLWLF